MAGSARAKHMHSVRGWSASKLPLGMVGSTFLRGHRKERGCLLVDVFATTFRAFDLVFLVFGKGQDYFKRFLAIFTVKLIARHSDLPKSGEGRVLRIMYACEQ